MSTLPESAQFNRETVRKMFRLWHDVARFSRLPGVQRLAACPCASKHLPPAEAARALLLRALDQLRPDPTQPPAPHERRWRTFIVLHAHYIEGKLQAELARELAIDEVSVRRALREGLDAIAEWLTCQLNAGEPCAGGGEQPAPQPTAQPQAASWEAMPRPQGPYVRPAALLDQAIEALRARRRLAIFGLPGMGKTTFALHVLRDARVRAAFPDGVLWVRCGQAPAVQAILGEWALALCADREAVHQCQSVEALTRLVSRCLSGRALVVALDDVWDADAVQPLLVGDEGCAYVFTTRFPWLAHTLAAGGMALHLSELSPAESRLLLTALLPSLESASPKLLDELIEMCGGLPLALNLWGRYLLRHAYAGQPRRIATALSTLRDTCRRLHIEVNAGGEHLSSVQSAVATSVALLTPPLQRALAALGALPPKPFTFDEAMALELLRAVLGGELEPAAALDHLVDLGLLEHNDGAYAIHPVIADFVRVGDQTDWAAARHAAADRLIRWVIDYDWHALRRLNGATAKLAEGSALILHAARLAAELGLAEAGYRILRSAFEALLLAEQSETAIRLVHIAERAAPSDDPAAREWLAAYRAIADFYANQTPEALARFKLACGARAPLDRDIHLTQLVHLAHAHLLMGQMREAFEIADRAMALLDTNTPLLVQLRLRLVRAAALGNLRHTAQQHHAVETELHELLHLAEAAEDAPLQTFALVSLAVLYRQSGRHADAVHYAERARAEARRLRFRSAEVRALIVLACVALDHGRFAQAEAWLNEAQAQANETQNKVQAALIHHVRAVLAMRQHHHEEARQAFDKALAIAETYHLTWLQASVRVEYGEFWLELNQPAQAEAIFTAGLPFAEQVGAHDLAALLRFGLARARLAQGDIGEALRLGQTALETLTAISHYRADEVSDWLEQATRVHHHINDKRASSLTDLRLPPLLSEEG